MGTCNNSLTDLQAPLLTVELVPSTSWFTNVRSHLPVEEWDLVRRAVYRRARYRYDEALQHLADANGWALEEARHHADAAFAQWNERREHEWTLDLGPLESEAYRQWIARRRPGGSSPHR